MARPFTPRSYQLDAIEQMCAKPAYGLFLDPGMGKTSSVLATLTLLRDAGEMRAALVIAPIRPARNVWPAECEKWDEFNNLRVSLVLGSAEQRLGALRRFADIYVINPENVAWLVELLQNGFDEFRPDVLVVDESTKFKNPSSKRFRALRLVLGRFRRRYVLTGTPAPQSLQDLWSQVAVLDNGERLGRSLTRFRQAYFLERPQYGGYSLWEPCEGAEDAIFSKIAPIAIRLDARKHLDMPNRIDNVIHVSLPADAWVMYEQLEKHFITDTLSGRVTAANAAVATGKLRQIVNGAVYDEDRAVHEIHTAKLEALADLIEEQSGQPLLVAVAYQHDADRIRAHLGDDTIPYLGGGMSSKYADDAIARWNRGEIPVLLAHPASVAHGLNLQSGGHSIVWFSLTWSLEDFLQMNARVWRQGQEHTVIIHYLIAANTIDEAVLGALRGKNAKQESLFDALQAYAKRRSTNATP